MRGRELGCLAVLVDEHYGDEAKTSGNFFGGYQFPQRSEPSDDCFAIR
jgi:hypothetical protein